MIQDYLNSFESFFYCKGNKLIDENNKAMKILYVDKVKLESDGVFILLNC